MAVHRGICKDNISLYTAAFKAYRRCRSMKPVEAIEEILKDVFILTALLAIIRGSPSLKAVIKSQSQHSYL